MPTQTYENHVQRVPAFGIMLLLLFFTIIGSCVNLYKSWGDHQRLYSASLILVLGIGATGGVIFGRVFALKAQDRAIRAEENLRHYVLTGKLLDPRLEPLQIVGLRFASDEEFVELARRAAEKNMKPDEIKRAVRSWRPDTYRA